LNLSPFPIVAVVTKSIHRDINICLFPMSLVQVVAQQGSVDTRP